ncbi:aminoglycoside phosphotransferase family protein [Kribbella turkmenica]|uniref:Aminoglycoside phosphotransferase family protein n=1 Tax=Kribbella turkmenica TaxID=2530375 RepID=A0A4R4W0Y8_9ACTN|nr:aminoglycoside phosphotransferase family protein [Kribbella turkmenica]TDD12169.1 aminoglycoside phosphotransferase family protein [Kribbella turkmenica]
MTWHPSPDWHRLTAGTGQVTGGVWFTPDGAVVKRLSPGVEDPRHHAYWRRQALVASSGVVAATPGLHSPTSLCVEEDSAGITMRMARVAPAAWTPLALAAALGRFAEAKVEEPAWSARDVLRERLRTVERRGGWSALPQYEALWERREAALAELDGLPRVPTHGDAHPVNLLGRDGDDVLAIDWEQFGLGPAGFDLGYLLLAVDTPLDDLLEAHGGDVDAVRRGAVLVAAYTGVSRAAWALTQPDPGDHVERLARLSGVLEEAGAARAG